MMNKKVLILLNCSLAPSPESIVTIVDAQRLAEKQGIFAEIGVCKQTANAFLVEQLFAMDVLENPEYSHLIIASDDIQYPPNFIVKLVGDDKDIVSGIYRERNPKKVNLALYMEDKTKLAEYVLNGNLVESKYSSGHSMTIKREVIEKMATCYPELEYLGENNKTVHSLFMPFVKDKKIYMDDWAFCERARNCGFTCWLDFSVKLKHRCDVWLEI